MVLAIYLEAKIVQIVGQHVNMVMRVTDVKIVNMDFMRVMELPKSIQLLELVQYVNVKVLNMTLKTSVLKHS